jgi:hypothetical protein
MFDANTKSARELLPFIPFGSGAGQNSLKPAGSKETDDLASFSLLVLTSVNSTIHSIEEIPIGPLYYWFMLPLLKSFLEE